MIIAGIDRGLDFDGMKQMDIGQIVDFVLEWNNTHMDEDAELEGSVGTRKATQADWDNFF